MILETLFNLIYGLLEIIVSFIPNLAGDFNPAYIDNIISTIMGVILNGYVILELFFPVDTFFMLLPFIILLINFEYVWSFIQFIIKKIPFLGIK